jgi:pimeloyl-ACP methyl ester carboxylesterase
MILGSTPPSVTVRQYIDGRYGQIHCRVARPGVGSSNRPIVAFHLTPYSGAIYETVLPLLGRDRFVVAPDTPGFGLSDPPAPYPEIADYAAAMGDVIDALGLSDVDLLGYHTGSVIGVELARQRPMQVHRLTLISAPLFTREELAKRMASWVSNSTPVGNGDLDNWLRTAIHWSMPSRTPEMILRVLADRLRHPAISWWGYRAVYRYPLAERLRVNGHELLLLNPQDDLCEYTLRAESLGNPLIEMRELEGWSHGFLDLCSEAFCELVLEYFDR